MHRFILGKVTAFVLAAGTGAEAAAQAASVETGQLLIKNPAVAASHGRELRATDLRLPGDALPREKPLRDRFLDKIMLGPAPSNYQEELLRFQERRTIERVITIPLDAGARLSPLLLLAGTALTKTPYAGIGGVLVGVGTGAAAVNGLLPRSDWDSLAAEIGYVFENYLVELRSQNPQAFQEARDFAKTGDLAGLEGWLLSQPGLASMLSSVVPGPLDAKPKDALVKSFVSVIASLAPVRWVNPASSADKRNDEEKAAGKRRARQTITKVADASAEEKKTAADLQNSLLRATASSIVIARQTSAFSWQSPRQQLATLTADSNRLGANCRQYLGAETSDAECGDYIKGLGNVIELDEKLATAEVTAQGGYLVAMVLSRAGIPVNVAGVDQTMRGIGLAKNLAVSIAQLYLSSGTNLAAWSGAFSSGIGLVAMLGNSGPSEQAQLMGLIQKVLEGQKKILEEIESLQRQVTDSKDYLAAEMETIKVVVDEQQRARMTKEYWTDVCVSALLLARRLYGMRNGVFPSYGHRGEFADELIKGGYNPVQCAQWLYKSVSVDDSPARQEKSAPEMLALRSWNGLDQWGDATQVYQPIEEFTRTVLAAERSDAKNSIRASCEARLLGVLAEAPSSFSDLDVTSLKCPLSESADQSQSTTIPQFRNNLADFVPEAADPFRESNLLLPLMVKQVALLATFNANFTPLWRNKPVARATGVDRVLACPAELNGVSPPVIYSSAPTTEVETLRRISRLAAVARQQVALRSGLAVAAPMADLLLESRFGERPGREVLLSASDASAIQNRVWLNGVHYDYQTLYEAQDWFDERYAILNERYRDAEKRLGCKRADAPNGRCDRAGVVREEADLVEALAAINDVVKRRDDVKDRPNGYEKLLVPFIRLSDVDRRGRRCRADAVAYANAPYLVFACLWSESEFATERKTRGGTAATVPGRELLINALNFLTLRELNKSNASLWSYEEFLSSSNPWFARAALPTLLDFIHWKDDLSDRPPGWYFRLRNLQGAIHWEPLPSVHLMRTGLVAYAGSMNDARAAVDIARWYLDGQDAWDASQADGASKDWPLMLALAAETPENGLIPWGDAPGTGQDLGLQPAQGPRSVSYCN